MHLRHQQAIFHSCKPKCMRNYSSQQNWSLPHLLACNRDGVWFIPEDITRCATTLLRTCWDNISHPLRPNQSAVEKKNTKKRSADSPASWRGLSAHSQHWAAGTGRAKAPMCSWCGWWRGWCTFSMGWIALLNLFSLPTGFRDWHLKSHREESGLEGLIWSLWSQGSRWECS